MKVKVVETSSNRYHLYVNSIHLGEWVYGEDKKYENPKKWAKEQIKKRNIVIDRNIERLQNELRELKEERIIINRK